MPLTVTIVTRNDLRREAYEKPIEKLDIRDVQNYVAERFLLSNEVYFVEGDQMKRLKSRTGTLGVFEFSSLLSFIEGTVDWPS